MSDRERECARSRMHYRAYKYTQIYVCVRGTKRAASLKSLEEGTQFKQTCPYICVCVRLHSGTIIIVFESNIRGINHKIVKYL